MTPPKILLVDDSKTIRMILARALRPFDCQIFEAGNGLEALDIAGREKPQLIIMDLTMPVMDGAQALDKLKGNSALKHIPVIMLTANVGLDDMLKITGSGNVSDFMNKAFKPEELIERIKRQIELPPKPAT